MSGLFTSTQLFGQILWSEQHQVKAQTTNAGEKNKFTQKDEREEEKPWKYTRLAGPLSALPTHGTGVKC